MLRSLRVNSVMSSSLLRPSQVAVLPADSIGLRRVSAYLNRAALSAPQGPVRESGTGLRQCAEPPCPTGIWDSVSPPHAAIGWASADQAWWPSRIKRSITDGCGDGIGMLFRAPESQYRSLQKK